jgi:ketosteroid isomerase-like protein
MISTLRWPYAADDAVVMAPDALAVLGRDAIRRLWMKEVPKPGESEVLDEKYVEVSTNVGWSSGTFKVTGAGGVEVAAGKFMSTWRKTNGKWLNVREIWNSDRPVSLISSAK